MSPQQLRSIVSANIRERRRVLGMNQQALATACQTRQATISRIECGKTPIDDVLLARLGEALSVHPAALMMESDQKAAKKNLKIGA